jgi:hypothetical protein
MAWAKPPFTGLLLVMLCLGCLHMRCAVLARVAPLRVRGRAVVYRFVCLAPLHWRVLVPRSREGVRSAERGRGRSEQPDHRRVRANRWSTPARAFAPQPRAAT